MLRKKVLLTSDLGTQTYQLLQDQGFDVSYKPNLSAARSRAELLQYLKDNPTNIFIGRISGTDKEVFDAAGDSLEAIICTGKGLDHIDLQEASRRNIKVRNTDVNSSPVAEMALGLILSEARKIHSIDHDIRNNKRQPRETYIGTELSSKVLGIIGTGSIGRQLGVKAKSLFGEVVAWNRSYANRELARRQGLSVIKGSEADSDLPWSERLVSILGQSDYVSLNLALNEQTKGMVDADFIKAMKDGAKLVNVSRVGLFNMEDVASALDSGKLSSVLVDGGVPKNSPLRNRDNVIITPHIASNTVENYTRISASVLQVISELYNTNLSKNTQIGAAR